MGEAKRKQEQGARSITNRCQCGWRVPSAFGLTPVTADGKTDATFVFTPELMKQLSRMAIQYQCPSCKAVFGVKLEPAAPPETPEKDEDHGPA